MVPDALLDSLRAAVDAAPDDLALRTHLAEMLARAGRRDEAVFHAGWVLRNDPRDQVALQVMVWAAAIDGETPQFTDADDSEATLEWLDRQLDDTAPDPTAQFTIDEVSERLVDVGGMDEVKRQLELSVLMPLRNRELGRQFGNVGRGGLLLYGPPGCGKTFLARALAGELGAGFLAVSMAQVLEMWVGQSERNLAELFALARRNTPCVIFFDEVDAIGQSRGQLEFSGRRGVVNQLLSEMDGVASNNEGVYVLGATNHPWDVDVALRRPGRLDRMLFVAPPDEPARRAVFEYHLRELPTVEIDMSRLAKDTDGYSGADIAYVCRRAAEEAMLRSAQTGELHALTTDGLADAAMQVRPSIGAWLDTARTVAEFANRDGAYDELARFLSRKRRR